MKWIRRRTKIDKEVWKELEYKDVIYQVSSWGNVKGKRKLLKQRENRDGYYEITVGTNKNRTTVRVHRLVALTFIKNDNPTYKTEVNHIDTNRKNNNINNLEWCSHIDNVAHSTKLGHYKGRYGEDNPNFNNHKLHNKFLENPELLKLQARPESQNGRARKIKLFDINMNYIDTFDWIGSCAKYLINNNYTKSKMSSVSGNIGQCCKNKSLKYEHYYEFLEEN